MLQFNMPERLKETLEADLTLAGLVQTLLATFGAWLEQNNVLFFIEYTDHSLRHVEEVLATADGLIRDECRAIVTPGDVAVLTLAALLHDAAMHLSEEGFAALLDPDGGWAPIDGFGDEPWPKLWHDFFAEARRFSGRKLMALFGDTEPVRYPRLDDKQQMTGRDLLLIGEFLRRHHHRLAHEIARRGVPGPGEERLAFQEREGIIHVADLAGLVARSHGMAIRDCLGYLEGKYGSKKVFRGIHPVFCMALLRVADVLQVHPERAPRQVVPRVRALSSPVSQGEWDAHQAVRDVNHDEYPETVYINAMPPDARTYVRLRRLLDQIQEELDGSWMALGEVYAYDPAFKELGLTVRRVCSNLDDVEAFAQQVDYVPCHASFEVADTDLLQLLIGPLYGEKPEIGIRELVQNGVDAVRELAEVRERRPELDEVELMEQAGDVVVSVNQDEDGDWWVEVSDRGIGMTLDTVREYYLKAGASLRRSDAWRKTFEDEEGKSRVLRSGRFGVGALATFLLGDEIEVSTRHVDAPLDSGIAFTTRLDAEEIELRHVERPVGTTVRVRISEEVKKRLLGDESKTDDALARDVKEARERWDWYCLEEPRVVRIADSGEELAQRWTLPAIGSELPPGWHRLIHPDFKDIHWTYGYRVCSEGSLKRTYTYMGTLSVACNGIVAGSRRSPECPLWEWGHLSVETPRVSVFDFDARLPLNLQRTELTGAYPFADELLDDVLRDYLAFLLVTVPHEPLCVPATLLWCLEHRYWGVRRIGRMFESLDLRPWFAVEAGLSLADDPWHITQAGVGSVLCIMAFAGGRLGFTGSVPSVAPGPNHALYVATFSAGRQRAERVRDLRRPITYAFGRRPSHGLRICLAPGRRALVSRRVLARMEEMENQLAELPAHLDRYGLLKQSLLPDNLMAEVVEEWSNDDWVLWRRGDCPSDCYDFERFAAENPAGDGSEWPGVLAEWYFKEELPEFEMSPIARVWKEVLGTHAIPFDLDERRDKLAHAYEELEPYIRAHETIRRESKVDPYA